MSETIRNFKETVEIRSSLLVRIRSHKYTPAAMLCLAILAGSCIHIWQRVHVMAVVQQVGLLKRENRLLADDVRKVYSEVSALSMSSRVQTFAADSLGLAQVAPEMMITLVPRKDEPEAPQSEDLDQVLLAMTKRVTDYMPRVTLDEAMAGEVRNIMIDSLISEGDE